MATATEAPPADEEATTPLAAVPDPDDDRSDDEDARVQLKLPGFEGQKVNTARLNISGNILIEEQDLADAVKLNREVEITVRGIIVNRSHKMQRDKEGAIVGTIVSSTLLVEEVALAGDGDE